MANEALKSEESPPDTGSNPSTYIRPQARKLHDPAVSFEEYHYYAVRTRKEELHLPAPKTNWREILLGKKPATELQPDTNAPRGVPDNEKYDKAPPDINLANPQRRLEITDEEWTNASRAFRSASWVACWYLITVDILGPYGVGFAIGTLGWGPGIALYTAFGGLAGYSGYLLHRCFLGLDSHQFPCKNYGDLALRIYGRTARYICNVLQAIALLLVLGQITIQQGQGLSQVSRFRLCYAVCPVLFIIVGFFLGQIRTLKQYGWVATLAVWLNLPVIFISMGVIADSPPKYAISTLGSSGAATNPATVAPDAAGNYPPIIHYSGLPTSKSLVGAINGLLSGIFAYAGAQLFIEFMAEMRRPRDFLKAMWGAQFFIYSIYLIYGCYVYCFQGQYSYQISYQGVSPYGWQTACNMIAILSGLIAAGLYGNIGIKVLYNNVLMDLFNAPPLITKTGKIFWVILVPNWWSVGYIIAAAIPDYFGFVSVVSAATAIQFSYTFPPMLALGYSIRLNIMRSTVGVEGFGPRTGTVNRPLSGMKYWIKGFFAGGPLAVMLNIWHLIYALGAWVLAGLGMYAAIEGLIDAFAMPQVNSFSCISPLDLAA